MDYERDDLAGSPGRGLAADRRASPDLTQPSV
jgi:hypothetical protein